MSELMKRAADLLRTVDEFGPMHIVVGDGNMEDHCLKFVEAEMAKEKPRPDEAELLALLKAMTEDARYAVWEMVYPD